MTKIVILGAGFGGLTCALNLEKQFRKNPNVSLTLVDRRDFHLFTPNLYEVAAAEEELVSVSQLKNSITLPLAEALKNKKISFFKGEIKEIDQQKKVVVLQSRRLEYDFLILALGSVSDYYDIPGAEQYALPLKTLRDALRIKNQIEFVVEAHKFESAKKTLRLVVAGGGYTGLELVTELKGLLDILAWKYQYPREKMEIEVIEANNKLIAGFDDRLSQDAYSRLTELGIRVRISSRISGASRHFVELMSGEKIAYDVLVWTTGVKAAPAACDIKLVLDGKARLCVNEFLQVMGLELAGGSKNYHNIFALGDMACVLGPNGRPVPGSAQDAIDQARYLARALPYIMKNQKPPKSYVAKKHGFIVALGGKWAIMSYNHVYLKGFFAYVVVQAAHLRYYASVVGWRKAFKYLWLQEKIYSRND